MKAGQEFCGSELLTDCTATIVKTRRLLDIRKARGYPAVQFAAFSKTELAGSGSAHKGVFPGSILDPRRLETTMCLTGCRATSSVPVVIKVRMGKCSLVALTGSMLFSLKMSGTIHMYRRS